jgi:hypothetical protein
MDLLEVQPVVQSLLEAVAVDIELQLDHFHMVDSNQHFDHTMQEEEVHSQH